MAAHAGPALKDATKARSDGFVVMLLGALGFLTLNFLFVFMARNTDSALIDFKAEYVAGRSLLQNLDPYNHDNLQRVFERVAGDLSSDSHGTYVREVLTWEVHLPSTFAITTPLALMPYGAAQAVWIIATGVSCLLAAFLVWDLAADYAPIWSAVFLGFCLLNTETSIIWGNAAGLAVSLCVIAVWCFLRERSILAGILCLAVSLALKPHDSGLLWLYLLIAGQPYRRRALQTLAIVVAFSLPMAAWIWSIAPHWLAEMGSNYAALFARGAINDPGPGTALSRGTCLIASLQSVFSFFRDEPRFYNLASYSVCLIPLLIWARLSVRARTSQQQKWLLIAAIAALTALPTYHRIYDAKLIILTIPAFAFLWASGGKVGRSAMVVTIICVFVTADLPWAVFLAFLGWLHPATTGWPATMQIVAKSFPIPLVLLGTAVFYLFAASDASKSQAAMSTP